MLLMIDNYDSFTYNLVHYFQELGQEVEVVRNDAITLEGIKKAQPEFLVLSPGPCNPDKAGISLAVVREFAGHIPILGVCLGHQTIVQALGGTIVQAKTIMHGKTSHIKHSGKGVFKDLPNPFVATRYHSLVADASTLPKALDITAWTEDSEGNCYEIMGVRHRELPVQGVQFHPESILTEAGHTLLRNFITHAD